MVMLYAAGHMEELMAENGMDAGQMAEMSKDPENMEQMLAQFGEISDSILTQIAIHTLLYLHHYSLNQLPRPSTYLEQLNHRYL